MGYLAAIAGVESDDELLAAAPVLIVPWLSLARAHRAPEQERAAAERETFVLSAGAAIQTLLLALSAQGLASSWTASSIWCRDRARAALGLDDEWLALGTVACGPSSQDAPSPSPTTDVLEIADFR